MRAKNHDLKSPLTFVHLADIHLGYRRFNRLSKNGFNQREVDVNLAFRETLDRIVSLKPKFVVVAGDLFHSVRPSNAIITFAFREFRRLAAELKCPIVIVAGNHESPKRSDSGSLLRLLGEIPGVYVADSVLSQFRFPEISVAVTCLPHAALENLSQIELRADDSMSYNILVTHAQIGVPWVSDFGGVTLSLEDLKLSEWDYVALGHVHSHRDIAVNASYCGAIERTAMNIWEDGGRRPGFLEIELPKLKRTFHSLTTPREVLTLEAIDAAELTPKEVNAAISKRLGQVAGGLHGKLVKLVLKSASKDLLRELDMQVLRDARQEAFHFSFEVRAAETSKVHPGEGPRMRTSLSEQLKEYSAKNGSEDVARALMGYLRRVEEVDEAAAPRT